jgi:hypothetical protein
MKTYKPMKTKSRSIHLIIQGPIFSPGINGKGEKVNYHCEQNINQLVDKYKNIFGHIVLATWKKEDISGINKRDNLHIIQVEDIGGDSKRTSYYWTTENIKRQFLSVWAATDYLSNLINDDDLVVKLRTDQSIDLCLLVDDLDKMHTHDDNKIFIADINSKYFYPSDYFWAGTLSTIQKFLTVQLNAISPLYNAHESMIYNYNKHNDKLSEFHLLIKLLFWGKMARAKHIQENFSLFPKQVMESCCWRGEYVKNFSQRQFDFQFPKRQLDLSFLMRKYINIKRYTNEGILKRKFSKNRLRKLKEIMENSNNEKILITYRPH